MRATSTVLLGMFTTGCLADIRPAIQATDDHLIAIQRVVSSPRGIEERVALANFHATRARGWTSAMLKHKGEPENPITIPYTPDDTREIADENAALREYHGKIEAEHAIKKGLGGLLAKLAGGATGMGGIATLLMMYRKKVKGLLGSIAGKDRAIDEYDTAIGKLPDAQRRKLGQGDSLRAEHNARKHRPAGSGTASSMSSGTG